MKRSRNNLCDRFGNCSRGMTVGVLLGVALVATAGPVASAQTITGVGDAPWGGACSPSGVSADGTTVVGSASTPNGARAFRWTSAGGAEDLGSLVVGATRSWAAAANSDGSVVVVNALIALHYRAFRWTSATGMQEIESPPGAQWPYVLAHDINGDGSVVVGTYAPAGADLRAFRWTVGEGMQDLNVLPYAYTVAYGVSSDGSVIAGLRDVPYLQAFRWTSSGGMEYLSGAPWGAALGISGDGNVIVGYAFDPGQPDDSEAARWSGGGITLLPYADTAYGANFDGSVVIGDYGAVWDSRSRYFHIHSYVASGGVDLTGWSLSRVTGISADGLTLVGTGLHDGRGEGWIARLRMAPCWADFNRDGQLNSQDFFDYLSAFFSSHPSADLNADGTVDSADFFGFLDTFFAGCP
jgi:probable HAF family extracellular repeat protein